MSLNLRNHKFESERNNSTKAKMMTIFLAALNEMDNEGTEIATTASVVLTSTEERLK